MPAATAGLVFEDRLKGCVRGHIGDFRLIRDSEVDRLFQHVLWLRTAHLPTVTDDNAISHANLAVELPLIRARELHGRLASSQRHKQYWHPFHLHLSFERWSAG